MGMTPRGSTFWEMLTASAEAHPDRVLVADDHGRTLTAVALRDAAERAAAGLVGEGVAPGDVVSWQLPTTIEAAVLMAAAARLGVVQNPIIPLLRHREIGSIARQIATDLLIVPERWRGFDHAAMGRDLGLRTLSLPFDGAPPADLRLPSGDPSTLPAPPTDDDACRWVYYSSGTTADPKGARHTDASVIASSRALVDLVGFRAEDVYPIAWPFTHIGGVAMLVTALRTGVRLVLFDSFDPATTAERMAAHGPTLMGSATPFFRAFLDAQRRHGAEPLFPHVRGAVAGGAPVPAEINREMRDVFGVPGVIGAYGLTEFPNCFSESSADPDVGSSVGHPADGVEFRIVDGELRLRGPQCFLGYVDTTRDADAFDDEGWFRTGDLAEVTTGRLRITGRLKDVIIRNAENISANEVEEVVLTHPRVRDVAVVGIPDPRTGERVCAVVVLDDGRSLAVDDLAAHCAGRGLARYKCPEAVVAVDAIERNPMGKIMKEPLRAMLRAPG